MLHKLCFLTNTVRYGGSLSSGMGSDLVLSKKESSEENPGFSLQPLFCRIKRGVLPRTPVLPLSFLPFYHSHSKNFASFIYLQILLYFHRIVAISLFCRNQLANLYSPLDCEFSDSTLYLLITISLKI